MSTTPNEPAPSLDAICALCGDMQRKHSTFRKACRHGDSWHPTNRFTPAQPDARAVGAKHTPLPWHLGNNRAIISDTENRWIAVCDEGYGLSREERFANAAHIAHCVNTLPVAQMALKCVSFYYHEWGGESPLPNWWPKEEGKQLSLGAIVSAALAAARDGSEALESDARARQRLTQSLDEAWAKLTAAEAKLEDVKCECEAFIDHGGEVSRQTAQVFLAIINRTES